LLGTSSASWDALSAFLVHRSVPWPEFVKVELFGASMFFAARAMHLLNMWLATHPDVRAYYLDDQSAPDRRPIPS